VAPGDVLAAVDQAVVATDRTGRILFWNAAAERLYGWRADEVLGRVVTEVTPTAASRPAAEEAVSALGRGRDRRGEVRVRRRDGTEFTAFVTGSPLTQDGEVIGVVGTSVDVSDEDRARAAIRLSETRLRTVIDAIDEGYCLCEMIVDDGGSPVDYRFLEVNSLFEEMTGLAAPMGRTARELVPDLESTWVETYARVGLGRETLRFEQGSAAMGRWFDVFAVPVEPHGHFALVFKDVTARRDAEAALVRSERRFRALADQLPVLVWQQDAAGRQEWVNQTFCEYFGVDREQTRGDAWRMLVHPDDGPGYVTEFLAAVADRRSFHGEVRVRRGDGSWRWLESWGEPQVTEDGEYAGHLGTSVDTTDRRLAEEALRENHRFISELTGLVPGVLYVYDLDEGRNVFVNRPTAELLGYPPEEILDLGPDFPARVLHPEDAAAFERHLAELRDLVDGATSQVEYRFRHRDGTWRWFVSRDLVLRRDAAGRARQILGLASDITERKQVEADLMRTAAVDAYRARLADGFRSERDPWGAAGFAARLLGEHLSAPEARYLETDASSGALVARSGRRQGSDRADEALGIDARARGELAVGQVVARSSVRLSPDHDAPGGSEPVEASLVVAPVRRDGRLVAAMLVRGPAHRDWAPSEITLMTETAERTWAAVQRLLAEEALRTRQLRTEMIADLLGALEGRRGVPEQVRALVDTLVGRWCDYATVEVPGRPDPLLAAGCVDPDLVGVLRELRTRHRLRRDEANSMGRAAAGEAQLIREISPAVIEEYAAHDETRRLLTRLAPRSHLAAPLRLPDGTRAAIMVGVRDPSPTRFGADDLAFLQEIVERTEQAMVTARLHEQEHAIAVRLQRSLLPDRLVAHPRLDVEARYQAGSEFLEVGGDWYDTFAWPDGRIGVVVGDVVGHTMDSAAAMGRLRAACAALAEHVPPSPAALLDALQSVARGPNGARFVTAGCVVVDTAAGRLTHSSAGHPPALMVRPGEEPTYLMTARTRPMCEPYPGDDGRARAEATVDLPPGSLVVLCSDGLVERRDEPLSVGMRRLARLADEHRDLPVTRVADALLAGMASDGRTEDDVVLVCLRHVGAAG
jgi:PAS domain S-box-containing protein